MRHAMVLLADGFEEMEAVIPLDLLRRAKIDCRAVSLGPRVVTGAHGISLIADLALSDVCSAQTELLILPGGMPGTTHLKESHELRRLLREQAARGALLAAICAAPLVLAAAGLLTGRRATIHPDHTACMKQCLLQPDAVVIDHNIITANGPAAAVPFALTLIAMLGGDAAALAATMGLAWQPLTRNIP
ncbi:MAG: DJ-1/PfpI family protein [Oscillospiraceae bacterium]